MQIILLNGPPGCGKDAAATQIWSSFDYTQMKFAGALKAATHTLFGLDPDISAYEDVKDKPLNDFMGYTPRDAYIRMSEDFVKKYYDKRFFGYVLAKQIERQKSSRIVISDSGFMLEAQGLMERFPDADYLLIRVEREGHDFIGDSRSYWPWQDMKGVNLDQFSTQAWENNGDLSAWQRKMIKVVDDWHSFLRKQQYREFTAMSTQEPNTEPSSLETISTEAYKIFEGELSIQDYADWTGTTAVYPGKGTGNMTELNYLLMALCGEVGETANLFKKALRVDRQMVPHELKDEMGDIFWYLCRLAAANGLTIRDILRANVAKIEGRKAAGTIASHD